MDNMPSPVPKGWLDSIKENFNIDMLMHRLDLSTSHIIEMAAYSGMGFCLGFFLKRYFRQAFFGLLIFFVVIKVLEYAGIGVLAMNWARVKELTGIAPHDTLEGLFHSSIAWMQNHARQTLSIGIGMLVGYKLG
jgi:uncharacterized membrane protein (Fun14 family)